MSKNESTNQLSSVLDYDVNRMVFSDPVVGNVPSADPKAGKGIQFKRINISTLYKDGTIGDLILPTTELFSYGVSENMSQDKKQCTGHTLPLCLWNRDGPSKEEKAWTDTFDKIVEHCKDHLLKNKEELELYDLEPANLKKLNPLYWKRDKGKIVDGTGPTLYAKLIESKKGGGKIISMFFNQEGESLDPLELQGKFCYAKAGIKIESIFIGSGKCTLQVKVYEAEVRLLDRVMKPLISRPKNTGRMITSSSSSSSESKVSHADTPEPLDDPDNGSLDGDDDTVEEKKSEKKKSPPTKRIVRRFGGKKIQ